VEDRTDEDRSKFLEAPSCLAQLLSYFSKSDITQHEEETMDLVTVLGKVRNEVFLEYHNLETLGNQKEDEERDEEDQEEDLLRMRRRKRLLYLFVKDLSSGVSEEVLSNKSERDSQMSRGSVSRKMDHVSWRLKRGAGICVGVLNTGMIFYIYLFAIHQTQSRQQAWFISFVMWLLFEIFLSSTALVIVFHLLIPLYVWSDVSEVKQRVLDDLIKFLKTIFKKTSAKNDIETGNGTAGAGTKTGAAGDEAEEWEEMREVTSDEKFNAAKYLYPSWRVASLFPDLPDSQFILRFSTPWPKKKFGNSVGDVAKEYKDDVILTAASRILLYFLTSLLRYSALVQEILVQTGCNSGLGYLCVLLVQLWTIHPWLSGLVLALVLLSLYLIGRFSLNGLAKKLQGTGGGTAAVAPEDKLALPGDEAQAYPTTVVPQVMQVTGGVWAPLEISSRPPVVVEEGSNGSLGGSDVEILSFANRSREMLEDIDDSGAGATPGSGVVELRSPTRL
jgi:hypothetical protein